MKLWSDSFKNGAAIPAEFAFAEPDAATRVRLAGNRNPHLAWDDIPPGTASLVLLCIDGDALLAPNTCAYLVAPMLDNARLGAVTGNPRIRTRSTLVGRVQVGEFSSIIGLIKRTQRVFGVG